MPGGFKFCVCVSSSVLSSVLFFVIKEERSNECNGLGEPRRRRLG